MINRIRYTRDNIISNSFYQLPKFLFDAEFSDLSNDARILYALLRNRHEISIKNGWYDEKGEVYLYFKREDMQNMLHLSENTVGKAMKVLKAYRLVEEEKQGFSKPNKIYLLSATVEPLGIEAVESIPAEFTAMENHHTRKIYGNGAAKFEVMEPQNLRVYKNHNNIIHNDINQRESQPAPVESVTAYGEFMHVKLTGTEHNQLVKCLGAEAVSYYINRIDRHVERTGRPNSKHYTVIKDWAEQDKMKGLLPAQPTPVQRQNRFVNYEQREWNYGALEQMEQEHLWQEYKSEGAETNDKAGTIEPIPNLSGIHS